AADSGADAVSLTNTFPGIVLDWRRRRPYLGNGPGGLSGPAIKPLSLRCVWNVARAVPGLPIVGIGGIATIDDVMDYLVAGASAVQMGTVNFYDPGAALRAIEALPGALGALGVASVAEAVGCAAGWKPQG
ncbi:MAG: dihydroorotate dehydrogenase, partial [Planctomycetota bacterium]